jgi:hypothetical protein
MHESYGSRFQVHLQESTDDTTNITGLRATPGDIKVSIDNSGNLGIGITTPDAPLAIYRASNPYMRINGGGAYSYIQLDDGTSNGYLIKNVSAGTGNGALAGALYTYTDSGKKTLGKR